MERLSNISVGVFALCMGLMVGCDSGGAAGSASASAKSSGSAKTATSTKASMSSTSSAGTTAKTTSSAMATDTGSAKAEGGDKKQIKPEDLAKEEASGDKNVLSVDLSKADNDAPTLGGGDEPPAPKEGKLEWLEAGGLMIPNPGWKHSTAADLGILESPDQKGGVVFTGFKSPEDGLKKVDEITAKLQLKNVKWSKPEEVLVGPDKLPGYAGGGKGEDEKGKPNKLFYALVKTGEADNLLAVGGADDDAEEDWKVVLDVIDSIKKKK